MAVGEWAARDGGVRKANPAGRGTTVAVAGGARSTDAPRWYTVRTYQTRYGGKANGHCK